MFTFSFGSAFAAVDPYNKGLATANFEVAMDAVKEAGEIELGAYTVDYATLNSYRAEILSVVLYEAEKGNLDYYIDGVDETATGGDNRTLAYFLINGGDDALDLATEIVAKQYEADKAEALAVLGGLDLSSFSTAAMPEKIDGCKTYREHVQYVINEAIKEIKDAGATLNADSDIDDYATAIAEVADHIAEFAGDDEILDETELVVEKGYEADGTPVGLKIYEVNANFDISGDGSATLETYKTTYVEGQDAADAAGIASVKAAIAQAYATELQTATTSADKTYLANVKKLLDFLAEEGVFEETTGLDAYFVQGTHTPTEVSGAIADAETFAAEAAKLAAQKDANGELVRDAEDVADLVTEGTIIAYIAAFDGAIAFTSEYLDAEGDPVDSTADCLVAINALYVGLGDAELEYMKAVRAKFVSKLLAAYAENETYYPAELEKIKAITEEYLAKVNAITDIDDIDMYDATYVGTITASVADYVEGGKIADIDDASDVAALAADLQTAAKKYAEFVNEQISKEANRYYVDEDSTASADDMEAAKLNELVADLVGNSGARLSKEIEALAEQAIALVKTLPTYAAVEAAKEAADDAVDALPTTAKIADKALVDAAIAAVDAYEDLCGEEYTDTAVVTAVTQYAHAYNNEFTAKVKAVSTTDKAAVEALIDELDAFVDAYEDYEANAGALYTIVGDGNGGNYDKLEGYLADIKSAAAKKVVEAFAAIPVTSNITEAARPAVEAARAAYDAYVAEYTDTTDYTYDATANHTANTDGFVADDFVVSTLFAAEAALGLETGVNMVTFDDVDAKAYLQDLAVKARSVKTAKGNIKVTVVADVDVLIENGYTVEYKFYRSTKSNKGFGKAKKVTEDNTYTNTSGVKGTKYYYKAVIVAKNAEGEVVAKTPLKHCLYAARTWSK